MQIVIDMDGTICTEMRQFSRCLAEPKADAVQTINDLYDAGNTTVDWLKRYGVKYHQLFMGKPIGDVWIDDRAITAKDNWKEIGEQLKSRKR